MTEVQRKWCESRLGTFMQPGGGTRGGIAVDYKPCDSDLGAIFVIERPNRSLVEEFRFFPRSLVRKSC